MSEINSPRPLPPTTPPVRSAATATDLAVRLLHPINGILAAGESARAEVVEVREQAQQFQLLLRLTLGDGRQSTVPAQSSRALAQGTQMVVTALNDTRLALSLGAGTNKPLTQIDLNQLPAATLVQGKVLSRELIAGANHTYRMVVNLLNTPLAGKQLLVDSPLQLPVGSLLTAEVKGAHSLAFTPLSGRLDQLALSQQLGQQQARQGSLDSALKALQGALNNASLDPNLRTSIERLLGGLPDASQLSQSKGLAQAFESSGLLFEAKLLRGQSALLPQDLKANLLRLISHLAPHLPGGTAQLNAQSTTLPMVARHLLGSLTGAIQARPPTGGFPLPSRLLADMDGEADLETLLKLAAAAVSRLQTHQLSSLAQTQVDANGNLVTTWQLELPMRQEQDVIPLQLKLQRETAAEKDAPDKEALWRIDLAFDLAGLGPLQVCAQLLKGRISSQWWAERPDTAQLIDSELDTLRERLDAAGLPVDELRCIQGRAPQPARTAIEQRWVDETA